MTELPYSVEVLAATLAAFNETWWPVVGVGFGAALWLLITTAGARPIRHKPALLYAAGLSAAVGGPYWLGTMAALDFMAPVYGGLWLLQAALLLFLGLRGGNRIVSEPARWQGAVIALGVVVYPVLFWIETGMIGMSLPLAGSAPDPTAIVLIGLLAGGHGRRAIAAMTVPAAWAGIAAFNGVLLGLFTPWLVAATLLVAVAARVHARRQAHDT